MFRFNFNVENDQDTRESNGIPPASDEPKEGQTCTSSNEIVIPLVPKKTATDDYSFRLVSVENHHFSIRYFDKERDFFQRDEFLSKFYSTCDVTPYVYEGGLKIWECTYDLLKYLIHNNIEFKNKTVLDLGCGCGILGIYAAQKAAETVHFHDYNIDVLRKFTVPNVTVNEIKSKTMFIGGDWGSFCNLSALENVTYDYILSSETLYNPTNYPKLCGIFSKKLKKDGKIFLASKSYYFGVGGNTKQFLDYLSHDKKFEWKVVWKNNEGVQREIISITLRDITV